MFKLILVLFFFLNSTQGDMTLEEMESKFPDICGLEKNITAIIADFSPEGQLTIAKTLHSINQYLRLEIMHTAAMVIDSEEINNLKEKSPELLEKIKELFGLRMEINGRLILGEGDRLLQLCEFNDRLREASKTLTYDEKMIVRGIVKKFEQRIKRRIPLIISQAVSDNKENIHVLMMKDSEKLQKVGKLITDFLEFARVMED
ncbi:hypothetical protein BpHYR1_011876 [Brachionus plicatilis]|uniref:Uncharacterized protein n=1 Tax=Brachionus plicatilis TaxID=10195 RepID=A0A3M7RPX7_BRAPC|nr:hypothetical protein BpHYR1_011876 [Brachionus plicatilis]